jgi:hypothetical protein
MLLLLRWALLSLLNFSRLKHFLWVKTFIVVVIVSKMLIVSNGNLWLEIIKILFFVGFTFEHGYNLWRETCDSVRCSAPLQFRQAYFPSFVSP